MKIETDNLVTVKNFAALEKVTTSYIYKLVKAGRMESVVIDGVQFIDITRFPSLEKVRKAAK